MHGKVFGLGYHGVRMIAPLTLKSLYHRHPHTGIEIGVFAICLLNPAPARVTRQAKHRAQQHIDAMRPCLGGNGPADIIGESRIPGSSYLQRYRKRSAPKTTLAMQPFFDK